MLESFCERLPDGRQRDHPGEKPPPRHDRNKQSQNVFHHPSRGLARSRSAKSIRSASSATSSRTCWSSVKISSRSAGSMPGLRCSPAIRFATAAATGRSTQKVPPKNMKAAMASGPRSEEHTSELQSLAYLVCRLLLEKKKNKKRSR